MLLEILLIAFGYLSGSFPTAYVIGKMRGVDIRDQGSGNVGGANAGRLFGRKAFAIVAIVDLLKGTLPVLVARAVYEWEWFGDYEVDLFGVTDSTIVAALAAFFAVFGHCYSIWIGFSGGKGGATSAGILLAINPLIMACALFIWSCIVYFSRYTSLGNLVTAFLLMPVLWFLTDENQWYALLGLLLLLLVFWKHRENIGRLLSGNERKFGRRETIKPSNDTADS